DHRQRRQRRHQREHAGGRLVALVPAEAGGQAKPEHDQRGELPAHPATSARSIRSAASSASSAAPPVARATSVEKCLPPPSTSAGGPSAIATPWPSSTTRLAKDAANSVS